MHAFKHFERLKTKNRKRQKKRRKINNKNTHSLSLSVRTKTLWLYFSWDLSLINASRTKCTSMGAWCLSVCVCVCALNKCQKYTNETIQERKKRIGKHNRFGASVCVSECACVIANNWNLESHKVFKRQRIYMREFFVDFFLIENRGYFLPRKNGFASILDNE